MKNVSSKRIIFAVVLWLLVIALMGFIFSMSAQPAVKSDRTSGGVIEELLKLLYPGFDGLSDAERTELIDSYQFFVRKAAHFSLYALLGALSFSALVVSVNPKGTKGLFLISDIAASIGLLYSVSDEIHQRFVPGRSGEVRDVIIDFAGVVIGVSVLMLIVLLVQKIKVKKNDKTALR